MDRLQPFGGYVSAMDKLNTTQMLQVVAEVTKRVKPSKELYGATLFKVVEEKFPDLVNDLKGTSLDCSIKNIAINPFLKRITVDTLHPLIDNVYH